MQSLEDLAVL
ncbi:uncharacterized protein FFB14_11402 [Fusarium fujikuroi]|nr:uncharacterized protein FFB14_11402 [Fusarium fujikuroi]